MSAKRAVSNSVNSSWTTVQTGCATCVRRKTVDIACCSSFFCLTAIYFCYGWTSFSNRRNCGGGAGAVGYGKKSKDTLFFAGRVAACEVQIRELRCCEYSKRPWMLHNGSGEMNTPSPYDASRIRNCSGMFRTSPARFNPNLRETDHLDPETPNFRAYPASSKEGLPPPCVQGL